MKAKKKLVLEDNFPSREVVNAYLDPRVDHSKESFTWSRPDLYGLRQFVQKKFHWSEQHADQFLLPLMKKYQEYSSQQQPKINHYFTQKTPTPLKQTSKKKTTPKTPKTPKTKTPPKKTPPKKRNTKVKSKKEEEEDDDFSNMPTTPVTSPAPKRRSTRNNKKITNTA